MKHETTPKILGKWKEENNIGNLWNNNASDHETTVKG